MRERMAHGGPAHAWKDPHATLRLRGRLDLIRRVVGRDRQAFETLYHPLFARRIPLLVEINPPARKR